MSNNHKTEENLQAQKEPPDMPVEQEVLPAEEVDDDGASQVSEASTAESAEAENADDVVSVAILQAEVDKITAECAQLKDQLLRVKADAENVYRRSQMEVEKARKYALDKFVGELLQVVDSMELGLKAALDPSTDVAKLREGTELTMKLLSTVMEKFGVKAIDPLNETFNPEMHQAISIQPSTEHEPNTVSNVVQKGYTLNDRLVRPAMVVVTK